MQMNQRASRHYSHMEKFCGQSAKKYPHAYKSCTLMYDIGTWDWFICCSGKFINKLVPGTVAQTDYAKQCSCYASSMGTWELILTGKEIRCSVNLFSAVMVINGIVVTLIQCEACI